MCDDELVMGLALEVVYALSHCQGHADRLKVAVQPDVRRGRAVTKGSSVALQACMLRYLQHTRHSSNVVHPRSFLSPEG